MAKIPEHYDADMITDASELENLCDRLADEGLAIGYDVETSYEGEPRADAAKHPEENFICGFSFTNSLSWARAVPVAFESGPNLDSGRAAKAVRHLAEARDSQGRPLLVPHNGVFELRCTARWFAYELGMTLEEAYWPLRSDTMVEAYIEAAHESYALKTLTWETFGIEQPSIMTLFESPGAKKLTKFQEDSIQFHLLDPSNPKVIGYMCDDAHRTLGHHLFRYPKVTDPAFRGAFLYKVDMGLLPVICAMSDAGIAYDWTMMAEAAQRGQAFLARLGAEINAMLSADLGRPVALNLASPLQIQRVLYDKADGLGLPVKRRSKKTNNPSTDKNAMKALADVHPVIRKIQSYRGIKRRVTDNYAGKYEQDYNYAPDGRAHPNILYTAVVTGRRAYSRPAAQQPPKTKTWQLDSGETFTFPWRDFITVPPPGALGDTERKGWYILGFDLSQAELRGMAGEAQEPALLEAYERGEDVHRLTASKMLGVPFGEVTDEQRSIGKAQPMTEPVLTPAGWRRMGDLQPGDQVIGGAGQPVKVTGVFPQGRKLVYRVITSDGASAECCAEHLWTARNRHTRSKVWKTRSLGAMLEKGLFGSARVVNGREYRKAKYELPERPVVQYSPPRRPPFSPYVMGLLLGDGGFTQRLQFCSADQDLLDAVRAEHEALGGRVTDEIDNGPGCRKIYLRAGQPYDRNGNLIKTVLEIQGLMGLRDHQKFIPDAFLLASPEDRLALLQGLLDTDGNALDSGAEFRVTSERLALGVQELARSLGGWASIKELDRVRTPYHVKSDPLPIWRVYLRLPAEVCPFRLERKRRSWKPARYRVNQCIFDVQAAGAKDCVCISVDSPDGLYVTSNYLVTHNTCNLALQYQMSAPSLAEWMGVPKDEGQRLYDAWFATYPRIKAWTEATVAAAVRDGYTMSRYGRKHPIWEFAKTCPACAKRGITSKWTHAAPRCPRCNFLGIPKSEAVIAKGMRLAGNAPIQGAATGDYMRIAMIRVDQALRKAGLREAVHPFLDVHDSLDFYVRRDLDPGEVIAVLQPAAVFEVPGWPEVVLDWHMGLRMGSLKELEIGPGLSWAVKGTKAEAAVPSEDDEDDEGPAPVAADLSAIKVPAALPGSDSDGDGGSQPEARSSGAGPRQRATADPGALAGSNPASPRPFAATSAGDGHQPRTVIVTLPVMPPAENARRLRAALGNLPGPNTVLLRTPAGDVQVPGTSGLAPEHAADVAFILPGASVAYDAASVDYAAIAEGIAV